MRQSQPTIAPARRGVAMVWTVLAIFGVLAMLSLAVDFARVQTARAELQSTADAVARAAADALDGGATAADSVATAIAAGSNVDGGTVAVQAGDVEYGAWDPSTRSFTAYTGTSRDSATAVRVRLYKNQARGNGVPLLFGQLFGVSNFGIGAASIATCSSYGYGMIGLDSITMSGNTTASYRSGQGGTGLKGSIASNGDITLSGSSLVRGDARPGIGRSVIGGAGRVTGSTAPLSSVISYPPESRNTYIYNNDNANLPAGALAPGNGANKWDMTIKSNNTLTISAGTYYVDDVSIQGTLSCTGPVTLVVQGNFSMSGRALTSANLPANFKLIMVRDSSNVIGTVSVSSASAFYGQIYAPESAISMSGNGDIYGSIIGKSITMSGTSAVYYDLNLSVPDGIKTVW
jgi:Flp pilus assembly protein TadG